MALVREMKTAGSWPISRYEYIVHRLLSVKMSWWSTRSNLKKNLVMHVLVSLII